MNVLFQLTLEQRGSDGVNLIYPLYGLLSGSFFRIRSVWKL